MTEIRLFEWSGGGDAVAIIFCGFDLGHCYVEEKRYDNIIFNFLNLFLYALNHKTSAYNYNNGHITFIAVTIIEPIAVN